MGNFRFSVLLPVYHGNTAHEFTVALNSILSQTLPASEIIIIQDGPVEEAIAQQLLALEQNPEVKIVRIATNTGIGNALNEGLKVCSNDWVARMDADDVSLPQRFEATVNFIQQHEGLDLVGSYYAEKQSEGIAFVRRVPLSFDKILPFSKYRTPHSHPTVFYRKSAVEKAGGYINFHFAEDWYLWLRMYKTGSQSANIPQVLVYAQTQNYGRRLGAGALRNDFKAIGGLYRQGYIGFHHFLFDIFVRTIVRLLPASLAGMIYKKYLRSEANN